MFPDWNIMVSGCQRDKPSFHSAFRSEERYFKNVIFWHAEPLLQRKI